MLVQRLGVKYVHGPAQIAGDFHAKTIDHGKRRVVWRGWWEWGKEINLIRHMSALLFNGKNAGSSAPLLLQHLFMVFVLLLLRHLSFQYCQLYHLNIIWTFQISQTLSHICEELYDTTISIIWIHSAHLLQLVLSRTLEFMRLLIMFVTFGSET